MLAQSPLHPPELEHLVLAAATNSGRAARRLKVETRIVIGQNSLICTTELPQGEFRRVGFEALPPLAVTGKPTLGKVFLSTIHDRAHF